MAKIHPVIVTITDGSKVHQVLGGMDEDGIVNGGYVSLYGIEYEAHDKYVNLGCTLTRVPMKKVMLLNMRYVVGIAQLEDEKDDEEDFIQVMVAS